MTAARDPEAEARALARGSSLGDLLRALVCGPLDDEADFAGNVLRGLADDLGALRRGEGAEVLVSIEYLHRLETRARLGAELARRIAEADRR